MGTGSVELTNTNASTRRVAADNAIEYAYRDTGDSAVPLVPDARVTIYLDSAHGFLFQHHSRFADDVHAFLEEPN